MFFFLFSFIYKKMFPAIFSMLVVPTKLSYSQHRDYAELQISDSLIEAVIMTTQDIKKDPLDGMGRKAQPL